MRPILAIYGTGIAGTFAWLFFALSGTTACGSGPETCRVVVGLTGQLALVWPAYWGGRISGGSAMTPVVPVEGLAVAILVFFVALILAKAYMMIERSGAASTRRDSLSRSADANRRNQSQA